MSFVTRVTRNIFTRPVSLKRPVNWTEQWRTFAATPVRTHSIPQQHYTEPSEDHLSRTSVITEELLSTLPNEEQYVGTVRPNLAEDFVLQSGAKLPKESIQIRYATFGKPELNKPIILLCPSMSNNVFAVDAADGSSRGWWRQVVGKGSQFGIDTDKFFVICGAPLGSPFGSTSPLTINSKTGAAWGPTFPQITPRDQASLQALLIESLGISKVRAVVGGSMGGMQSIQFTVNFPHLYDTFVSIASTAQTSPGIVALRSVQREAVRMDPNYKNGYYDPEHPPTSGMRVARMFGTICYRSHDEFVERFDWYPSKRVIRESKGEFEIKDAEYTFEVENYLNHQADIFVSRSKYDANCWLLNSKSMDLMDIGGGERSFEDAVARVPSSKQGLLLSYSTDRLTPPEDLERFSSVLGRHHVKNHFEVLRSKFGHDAFLIEKESNPLNLRLKAFLEGDADQSVERVHQLFREMYHQ